MTQQPSRAGTFGAILRVTSGNFLELNRPGNPGD